MYGEFLSLNVDDVSSKIDFELAIEAAKYYGLDKSTAVEEVKHISNRVSDNWRLDARKYDISRNEIEKMRMVFDKNTK